MFDWHIYLGGLAVMIVLAIATWIASIVKKDTSIVDSLWSILFLIGSAVYVWQGSRSDRALLVLALTAIWALRLSIYITARNWGEPEDRRYQAIRKHNSPNFAFKSLYIVFLFQAVLAWVVSSPLLAAATSLQSLNLLDYLGALVVIFGTLFETIGDWQLARFKSDRANQGKVMDRGLWRYTRHPNYFGECCVWWGFYLIALAAGGWWSVVGPLVMTTLLLKVSGVAMLERDIAKRRPEYRRYIEQTNAFVPGPRRSV